MKSPSLLQATLILLSFMASSACCSLLIKPWDCCPLKGSAWTRVIRSWTTSAAVFTLTVNVQVAARFEASVAVQVTVVVPIAKTEPEAGVQPTVTPGQLSLAVAEKNAFAPVGQVGSLTMLAGQLIVGGVLSTTVTVAVQVAVLLLGSFTVSVTVFGPLLAQPKVLVAAPSISSSATAQLSVEPLLMSAALTVTVPGDVALRLTVILLHNAVGGVLSTTVTLNVHCTPARAELQMTIVSPTGKNDPDGGSHVGGSDPQFPAGVGSGNVTTAPHTFGSLFTV
jgi:hypothetical protein